MNRLPTACLLALLVCGGCRQMPHDFMAVPRPSLTIPTIDITWSIVVVSPPNEAQHQVVTLLPPEVFVQKGLPADAIAGRVKASAGTDGRFRPRDFVTNMGFMAVLQRAVVASVPGIREYQQEAADVGDGSLFVIDGRNKRSERLVPSHDILGVFTVRHGTLDRTSYVANPRYPLYTDDGFVKLHAGIVERLGQDISAVVQ